MSRYKIIHQTPYYREYVNLITGELRRLRMASPSQMRLLNDLRMELGKQPLVTQRTSYNANKLIQKNLKKIEERDNQLKLF